MLRLPGMLNARDLGGLATHDGRRVRRGAIYRSDFPNLWEADAGWVVRELGLRRVVDLRRATEAAAELVDWQTFGVEYRRCPFVAARADSWHAQYVGYLTHRPELIASAVRVVLDPGAGPVLFHCAAGKDRTGVLAALVLRLLGVAPEEIVADYLLSAGSVVPVVGRLRGIPAYAEMLADIDAVQQMPRAESMRHLLDWVDAQGGVEEWLAQHGMNWAQQRLARDGALAEA